MANRQQPELFSANLFTTSGSGGAEPFGFGDSSGALPSAPILFAGAPSGASAVDPFASLTSATPNSSNSNSNTAQEISNAFQAPGTAASVDGRGSVDVGASPAAVQREAAPAELVPTTLPQQQLAYGNAPQLDNSAGSTGGAPVPSHYHTAAAVPDTGAAHTRIGPIAPVSSISSTAHLQQLAGPAMFTVGGSQHSSAAQTALAGPAATMPATQLSSQAVNLAGPMAGFAVAPTNLVGPVSTTGMPTSNVYSSTQQQQHNQSSVMEPLDISSPTTAASLAGFGDGGFPMQQQQLGQPLTSTTASHQQQQLGMDAASLVGPPQVSAQVQPASTGVPGIGAYPSFQQPSQMRELPIEQEWREQQRMVESYIPPMEHHWFYYRQDKWTPFSLADSTSLEQAHSNSLLANSVDFSSFVPTEGGRYDVELESRQRHSVYWDEESCEVRRCSWFFKPDPASDFVPYKEDESEMLEKHYQKLCIANVWPARFDFKGSTIHLHNATAIVHLPPLPAVPGPVRRGLDPAESLDEGEPSEVDHLVFVVHGVGPVADLAFRSIFRAVDDWRQISQEMMQQHFPHRRNHRVEFLPVAWHESLHGDTTGVNRKLHDITLRSCGRLRDFINDFLLDILFYMSPAYCQTINSTVAGEMERMHNLFLSRNPSFQGDVSVMGHSLGSCILFDLLAHQGVPATPQAPNSHEAPEEQNLESVDDELTEEKLSIKPPEPITVESALTMFELDSFIEKFEEEKIDLESFQLMGSDDFKELGIPMGPRKKLIGYLREHNDAQEAYKRRVADAEARKKVALAAREERELRRKQAEKEKETSAAREAAEGIHRIAFQHGCAGIGQPLVRYPQLSFKVKSLYCLGSPIGMFVTVRGGRLGPDFSLPTCSRVVNIFHPFDPVAYRIEPLVNLAANSVPPSLVPHHKGRKRLHLELRENLGRVGANLKKNFLESMRYTWQAVQQFAASHNVSAWQEQVAKEQLEQQEKVQAELEAVSSDQDQETDEPPVEPPPSLDLGKLNNGERIDFVLQEHPLESFNEYLFAMQSHLCYWTSEDSSLHILRHLYGNDNPAPFLPSQPPAPEETHLTLS
ncbi:phospholipase DDHD2-like [Sycon ciliatum]|uniref:phospholipase DDHD2-like n=1 Tax=Sycon ciliatum TaxID=27933 RepID=UPI0031F6EB32